MAHCDVCGNEDDQAFTVTTANGDSYIFDSFECAAQAIAPLCHNCGCRILGHQLRSAGRVFCCVSCADQAAFVSTHA